MPLLASALGVFLAVVVWRAKPRGDINRRLVLVLGVEVAIAGSFALGVSGQAGSDHAIDEAGFTVMVLGVLMLPWVYLPFLAAVESPLVRWLRRRWVIGWTRAFLVGVPLLLEAFALLSGGFAEFDFVEPWVYIAMGLLLGTFAVEILVSVFGLFVAVSAYRHAHGTALKERARYLAWAFGVRDGLVLVALISLPLSNFRPLADLWFFTFVAVGGAVALVYAPLLAYGVLKAQLFDVDLKLKVSLRRGTVAVPFVAAFVIGTVMAENFLTARYGWAAGGAAAGLLLLAMRPMQHVADRFADTAMPRVQDTQEYRLVRKREVFLAAYETAVADDGTITPREKDVLATLADQLGLSAGEARSLERQMETTFRASMT
ncbi:MAG: hypothetical protein HYT80_02370 [Euryarchaeota archaeon]|nr:hypothetical protein [Euryarchaeota archaeon]